MKKLDLTNEVFALRHGEHLQGFLEEPETGDWIAVMLRSVEMPSGPRQEKRKSDGAPVEMCAILACHKVDGAWQWLQLSAVSKEVIGDHFFDSNAPKDVWLYLQIT